MKKLEELNYYEFLNLDRSATREDIEKAYLLALATFRPDGFATYSVLTEEERETSLRRVEQAFDVLRDPVKRGTYDRLLGRVSGDHLLRVAGLVKKSLPPQQEVPAPEPGFWKRLASHLRPADRRSDPEEAREKHPDLATSSLSEGYILSRGQYLRTVRLSRGLSLESVAESTRINIIYLRALEDEEYDQLPRGSYLQYMLAAYAKSLKLDPGWIVRDFKPAPKG